MQDETLLCAMNRLQGLAILCIAINLLLVCLFPPYDYLSMQRGVPTFDGFYFVFGERINQRINTDLLAIEIIALLVNAGIGVLSIRPARSLEDYFLSLTAGKQHVASFTN